jgi:arginine utilization regulatory protein
VVNVIPFISQQHTENLLELLHEGIQIVDAQGMFVFCNEAAAMLDSLKKEEVMGGIFSKCILR